MDSDVSAEGDVKSDRSDQPSSPDVNSDDDSSSAESSPAARRTSSPESSPAARKTSSPESSPAAREKSSPESSPTARKTSSAESSPAPARTSSAESSPTHQRTSSAESSPAPRKVSSRDSSPDAEDMSSEKESSSDTRAPSRRTGRDSWTANSGWQSGDEDAEVKVNSRGQTLSPVNSDSQESVDDELDTKITSPGQESVNDEIDAKITSPGRGSSPANSDGEVSADDEIDTKITSPGRGSSPANSDGQESMDDEEHAKITSPDRESFVANSDGQESVDDEAKITSPGRESSPDVKDGYPPRTDPVDSGHELSPNVEHERVSDRELSPEPERESSPDNKSYHKYSSRSPDDGLYERINGNVSPKRSNSFVSDDHSDIASLDSVSPTQFEQHETKPDYDDREIEEDSEKISNKKKTIIDFADDLSDVSDIESNDSFSGQDKDMEIDKDELNIDGKVEKQAEEEEQEKIEPPKENEVIQDQTNGEVIDDKHDDAVSIHMDGEEQLDFEAEEGEVSPKPEKKVRDEPKKEKELSDLEEGELTDDADAKPEETERPVCRFFSRGHCTWGSNCRFIHPGVMDKGNYSMFDTVRPIVTPGGPPPPNAGGPVMYPGFPPHIMPPHLAPERAGMIPAGGGPRKEESGSESAWERGLRQAKEMIRKSTKRKETEVDFEDKKMNLTLSQDEIDKENDYYSRHSGSPPNKSPDLAEKWKMEADAKAHRTEGYPGDGPVAGSHGNDVPPLGYYPPLHHRPDYWNHHHRMGGLPYDEYGLRGPPVPYGPDYYGPAGRRYMHANSYYPPRPGVGGPPPSHHADFYDRKQKHKPYPGSNREVIVQKNDKPYKDERYRGRREESPRLDRGRDDEWADPWMRTKSPASGRRRRRRKNTYSSGSSYSSSSGSSRSSSRSSLSSRSHQSRSRSKGRSSGSGTQSSSRSAPDTQTGKKPPMQFKLSPSSRTQLAGSKKTPKIISPSVMMDRRALNERPMHMNPPPPSPKVKTRPHSPPTGLAVSTNSPLKAKSGLPERLLAHSKAAVAAAMRSTRSSDSRSSKSSSGSSSSDSSSDSSDSSASSSSSSKSSKTPPVRVPKRIVPEDHSATSQTVKAKAMDALKLSGQKQQIKLTLKGSNASKRAVPDNIENRKAERATVVGKKRVAESSDSNSDSDTPAKKSKINQKRGVPSRREELLKQLRAVEDAIARKRSKNL